MSEGINSPKPTSAVVVGGVYNAVAPTLVDGQAAAVQLDINGQLKTASGGGGGGNVNITGINSVAPALTNPLPVELSDGTNPVGTAGNPLSVNVITGGGSNASVGTTGATAPTSATEIGVIDGTGKLQGASASNPVRIDPTGTTPQPVSATSLPLPTLASTSTKQSDGSQKTQVVDGSGNIVGTTGNALDVNVKTPNPLPISAASLPLPTLAATSTKQSDGTQKSQIVDGSGNVIGATSNALDVNIKSGITNPLPISGTVTANQGTANATPWNENVSQWGATAVQAAQTSSTDGTGANPIIRSINRKYLAVSTTTPLAGAATFTSAWIDTQQTGDAFVEVTARADQIAGSGASFRIEGSDDSSNSNLTITLASYNGPSANPLTANTTGSIAANISTRYWRVIYVNGATLQGSFELVATASSVFNPALFPTFNASGGASAIGSQHAPMVFNNTGSNQLYSLIVVNATNSTGADGLTNVIAGVNGGNSASVQPLYSAAGYAYNGATSDRVRTPVVWRGSQFSAAGQNNLWVPPSTKKVRLMRYKIEIGEDATITSGPLPINLAFTEQLGTATGATLAYPGFGFTHREVIPATVLATGANLSDSDWIDLGNGQLLTTAGRALQMGIMVPQTTAAVNPSWTIASNQWEAATIGFKTNGSLGNFKLVQQTNVVGSAAAAATPAIQSVSGNSIFVFIRLTRAAGGGTPTVVVTDTAGNTYTNSAFTTNASDNANGSIILVASSTNIVGNAANVVTVTTSVNVATQTEVIALEYSGMGTGGVDAALVGTTGNSTTPASGNYTPATAGDLIFSFFGTSASLASQPTVGSSFQLRGTLFNATQGALGVSDNFGNGSLATGIVNVMTIGTEE